MKKIGDTGIVRRLGWVYLAGAGALRAYIALDDHIHPSSSPPASFEERLFEQSQLLGASLLWPGFVGLVAIDMIKDVMARRRYQDGQFHY